jgi:hypothetical protein
VKHYSIHTEDAYCGLDQAGHFSSMASGIPRRWAALVTNGGSTTRPIRGATGASLTLANVQLDQSGDYSVEVRNQFGTVVTPEARLTIVP